MATLSDESLPHSDSPGLVLRNPTVEECVKIWKNTSSEWGDSLTPSLYLGESFYLTTVPLARNGGMASWILVDKDHAPGKRQILCSCETFYKRSLTSNTSGTISDNVTYGIASVFCPHPYRRRGYAARMMRELANALYSWQMKDVPCVGTTLYSDIGKEYYSKLGWPCNKTN
jgi:hypothetical protein